MYWDYIFLKPCVLEITSVDEFTDEIMGLGSASK